MHIDDWCVLAGDNVEMLYGQTRTKKGKRRGKPREVYVDLFQLEYDDETQALIRVSAARRGRMTVHPVTLGRPLQSYVEQLPPTERADLLDEPSCEFWLATSFNLGGPDVTD